MKTLKQLRNTLIIFVLIFFFSFSAFGENTDSIPDKQIGFIEKVIRFFTIERENISIALYPTASFSYQTGLAVGFLPMVQFQMKKSENPSNITTSFSISTKKMFQAQCDADLYFAGNSNIISKFEFFRIPDKFYGVGNQKDKEPLANYDFRRLLLTADMMHEFGNFQAGLTFDFSRQSFLDIEAETASIQFIENQQGWSNGMGVALAFDNRDDLLSPRQGWLLRAHALRYASFFGSDFDFSSLTLDARRYLPVGEASTFALQCYWSGARGDVPFHKLPTCGGTRLGRAISHSLKYIDNVAWLCQGELRFPLFWRLGATTFVAAGNVSPKFFSHQAYEDCHLMAGAGLRFKVFPSKNLKVRLDFGLSSRKENAIYINVKEAF